jgi:hypothetical protein
MKKLFQFGLLFAAFCALFGRADAADDTETRSIPIDARVVRVKLDGVIDLKLRQGDVASLRLIGEKRYLDKLTASQSGDTLHLETEARRQDRPRRHPRRAGAADAARGGVGRRGLDRDQWLQRRRAGTDDGRRRQHEGGV